MSREKFNLKTSQPSLKRASITSGDDEDGPRVAKILAFLLRFIYFTYSGENTFGGL